MIAEPAGDLLGAATAPIFGLGSFLRRSRVVHPVGTAFDVDVQIDERSPLLARSALGRVGVAPGVLRLSRGLGRGPEQPDYRGFALKTGAGTPTEQDLLLVSTVRSGSRERLAQRSNYDCRYCSVVAFDAGAGPVVFHAMPSAPIPPDRDVDDGRLAPVAFRLSVGRVGGPWLPFATVLVGAPLSAGRTERLRFDPADAGGEIVPTGALNAARRIVYPVSQLGRAVWWPVRARRAGATHPRASAARLSSPGTR